MTLSQESQATFSLSFRYQLCLALLLMFISNFFSVSSDAPRRAVTAIVSVLFLLLFAQQAVGQKIENAAAQVQGTEIIISYDLTYSGSRPLFYEVSVSRSDDGGVSFTNALSQVAGDVGTVTKGRGKRIVWSPLSEFPSPYTATNLIFRINAKATNTEGYLDVAYGSPESDSALGLIPTSDGGFAMAGYTDKEDRRGDAWLVKADATGKVQWIRFSGKMVRERLISSYKPLTVVLP